MNRYIRNAQTFLFVYDITYRESFDDIVILRGQIGKTRSSVPMVLVGNKCDLSNEREVGIVEGENLARSLGCPFFETSAKTPINVTESFCSAVQEITRNRILGRKPGKH